MNSTPTSINYDTYGLEMSSPLDFISFDEEEFLFQEDMFKKYDDFEMPLNLQGAELNNYGYNNSQVQQQSVLSDSNECVGQTETFIVNNDCNSQQVLCNCNPCLDLGQTVVINNCYDSQQMLCNCNPCPGLGQTVIVNNGYDSQQELCDCNPCLGGLGLGQTVVVNNGFYSQVLRGSVPCHCKLQRIVNNDYSLPSIPAQQYLLPPLTAASQLINGETSYNYFDEQSMQWQPNNSCQIPTLLGPPPLLQNMDNITVSSDSTNHNPKVSRWTEEEHRMFLKGVEKYGKGKWKKISKNFVPTKSNTQIASHAQKYYQRQDLLNTQLQSMQPRRRKSIHDLSIASI